ncbi:Response regulator receiver domain protein [Desulfamplus magnetovallimortis]|uniref:Response regulator receiver domain protein n=1 Tax=Desulfamplus magnetovallimortis TaxID=1246637 RepID=A0A1W1H6D2_9BACT|nr:response regulator [Desulfamplus magnetovallimortis]SLM28023.1 Response regulator receiver domain protein [Desulfamplus magnetovallimortis]
MEKMKMMLVDDEERYLKTTSKLIQKRGVEVLTASSGKDALEILQRNLVHVVILDVKMPDMDGNETLQEIKKRFPLVEVIMLTGHATVDSAIDGLKAGAFDYLMKPADIDEIMEKSINAFEKLQKHEEKIRVAQAKKYMRSPREILKEDIE